MMRVTRRQSGISFIEILVVLLILGALTLAVSPAITNVLKNRTLEGAARGISMELTRARNLAIKQKLSVRVHFVQAADGAWVYTLESIGDAGTWEAWPGAPQYFIPRELQVLINLPDQSVEFSSLGYVQGYSAMQNMISLSNPALKQLNQPDVRNLLIYAGGSFEYIKTVS